MLPFLFRRVVCITQTVGRGLAPAVNSTFSGIQIVRRTIPSVSKNLSVGATLGRPQILHRKICSPQGENIHDFP